MQTLGCSCVLLRRKINFFTNSLALRLQNAIEIHSEQQNLCVNSGQCADRPCAAAAGITTNQKPPENRADAVMDRLIAEDMKPDLVAALGYGQAAPVA
jgi:hypothetical protein